MMIPSFTLPSQQGVTITLREATVSDLLDFADSDPAFEEKVTTLFLNRLQDKATFVDSKEWTVEDRRFALYWYWLHTTDDAEVAIKYECGHCGKTHTFLQDYRKIGDTYQSIKGLPERDIEIDGKRITVKPLNGGDAEIIEGMTLLGDGRKERAKRRIERLGRVANIPVAEIAALTVKKFRILEASIEEALSDLQHGFEIYVDGTQTSFVLPPHICPNNKEVQTRVRVLFRAYDFIPAL